ncbi:MAG TPA: hypothetical protein VHK90_00230, partial [Thermoanaerobaculia bacterium]|nr:hypothetical protein [Thermoanaerobaculia bacterium]
FQVVVQDTSPPVLTNMSATPGGLWPPDHKMIDVVVRATPVDAVDPTPSVKILSVSSNQPINGTGDGDTAPDWEITGPMTLKLRAERSANKERVYTIVLQTQDAIGNVGTSTLQVRVADTKKRASRH